MVFHDTPYRLFLRGLGILQKGLGKKIPTRKSFSLLGDFFPNRYDSYLQGKNYSCKGKNLQTVSFQAILYLKGRGNHHFLPPRGTESPYLITSPASRTTEELTAGRSSNVPDRSPLSPFSSPASTLVLPFLFSCQCPSRSDDDDALVVMLYCYVEKSGPPG